MMAASRTPIPAAIMKKLAISTVAVAMLAGCAAPGPYYTGQSATAPNPDGWQVVSVTPVPMGTGAQAAANGQAGVVTSTPLPAGSVYGQAPQPVYQPQPVYVEQPNYWALPLIIGLGFDFGRWGGHRHHGWSGHVGTQFQPRIPLKTPPRRR